MRKTRLLLSSVLLFISSPAWADKTQLDPGEDALPFRTPLINADKAKQSYFALEDVVGAEANPKKKLVLMSFFATYCEPCKRELPYLSALNAEYRDKGLQVISISIDKDEDKLKEVSELVEKHNLVHPVLRDRFQIVAKRYYVSKLPCLYLIDGNMKVASVSVGYDDNASRDILAKVRKGLGIPESDPVPPSLAKFLIHDKAGAAAPTATPKAAEDDKKKKSGKGTPKSKKKAG